MQGRYWNLCIGLVFCAFSLFSLLWWIPGDTETGILVEDRYSIEVGDAMAPTMVAIGILLVSLILIVGALYRPGAQPADDAEGQIGLSLENTKNMSVAALLIISSLALMIWCGPLTVSLLQALGVDVPEYRLLSAAVPYKYIGFATGGFVLVFGLISWIEGKMSWRAAVVATGAVISLIVIYDVPFDSLLLPPNGSLG
ncbi:MAG: hypothetical protein HKN05_13645 [Rhizobiales bacterium]|nr:hypothetical protein [Hyphomicrobiales bacterium]